MRSVSGREDGLHLDTADTSAVLDSDSNVTLLSPLGGPRVLNDVEWTSSSVGSVTNSEDTVVEGSSAGSAGDDTTGVLVEHGLVGLDGNGDWSLVEGSHEL